MIGYISTKTDALMIEKKKQQLYKEANQWLLKANINADNRQINDC